MTETKLLLTKLHKTDIEYGYSEKQIKTNFVNAMNQICKLYLNINNRYEKAMDKIASNKNKWDFVLVKRAFFRYAENIKWLYEDPFYEKSEICIKGILNDLENEKIEDYLSPTLTKEQKDNFILDLQQFDEYKNFLHTFVKHFECYLRFYYLTLKKKYYFCFEMLVDVCYQNKNIEKLNQTLIDLCNKYCKHLKK